MLREQEWKKNKRKERRTEIEVNRSDVVCAGQFHSLTQRKCSKEEERQQHAKQMKR